MTTSYQISIVKPDPIYETVMVSEVSVAVIVMVLEPDVKGTWAAVN